MKVFWLQHNHTTALRNNILAALLILAAIILTYKGIITGEFVVDDNVWAALPKAANPLGNISSVFSTWGFSGTSLQIKGPPIYRPIGSLILILFHNIFGPNPIAFHLLSLLCHYINSLLVFTLLGLLLPTIPMAYRLLPALAFAVHPAVTEAVAWISSVGELQMASCVLVAMITYIYWKNSGKTAWLIATAASALTGVLIKESALAFILLIIAFDWCRDKKLQWRSILVISSGTLFYLSWRLLVIGSVAGGKRLTYSIENFTKFLLAHLRYLFIPGQQPFSISSVEEPVAGTAAIALTIMLLILLILWGWHQTTEAKSSLCFGGAWIVITLWPAYALAFVGAGFFAGRHIYLPAIGWALLLTVVLAELAQRFPSLKYISVCGLLLMAVLAARGANSWRSNIDVYQRSVSLSPNYSEPLSGLADALLKAGATGRATETYQKLLERAPNRQLRNNYLYALALISSDAGNLTQSNQYLDKILLDTPEHAAAWVGLGNNAWLSGNTLAAREYYKKALQLEPENNEANRNNAELMKAMKANQPTEY